MSKKIAISFLRFLFYFYFFVSIIILSLNYLQNVKAQKTIDKINTWMQHTTKGLIRNIVEYDEAMTKYTRLILMNALYFKGAWEIPFDPSTIRTENFYTLNESNHVVQVPYLCNNDDNGSYASSDGFKILRLPYEKSYPYRDSLAFAMYIFLPDENDGLLNLLDKLSSNPSLLDVPRKFEVMYRIRKLRIPKFKFVSNFQVLKIMERMGLEMNNTEILEALNDDNDDNIPLMNITNIFHGSCINVNEDGTEATDVGEVVDLAFCLKPPTPKYVDFVANHSFVFMIREDTLRTPIFLGAVVNPLLE